MFLVFLFWLGVHAKHSSSLDQWLESKENLSINVWIFFKVPEPSLEDLAIAKSVLSSDTLARRKRSQLPLVDSHDVPIPPHFVNKLSSLGLLVRVQSKWLKAVSTTISSPEQLQQISSLEWVSKIDVVAKYKKSETRTGLFLFTCLTLKKPKNFLKGKRLIPNMENQK